MRRLRPAIVAAVAGFFLILHQSSAPAESSRATSGRTFQELPINTNPDTARISSDDDQRHWATYVAVRNLFERLWLHPSGEKVLKRGSFTTFKTFSVLELQDRDRDGKADFFAYERPDRSGNSQEFGAFFDLNGDGRPDCIVFYGGLLFTKSMKVFTWYHVAMDTNADGRFDVRVYGGIDSDGDGVADEGATAWVYDTNFDGRVDKAELVVDGHVTPIKPDNGALPLHYVLNIDPADQPKVGEAMPVRTFAAIADDIALLSRR